MNGGIVKITGSPYMFVPLLIYPFFGIGPALTCTYGLRSKCAHWTYLVLYTLGVILLSYLGSLGYLPGFILLLPQVFNGIAALLSAITAYRKKKTAMAVHCSLIAILLVILLANTIF